MRIHILDGCESRLAVSYLDCSIGTENLGRQGFEGIHLQEIEENYFMSVQDLHHITGLSSEKRPTAHLLLIRCKDSQSSDGR